MDIPRTSTGKIQKFVLRAQAKELAEGTPVELLANV
jgi:acyl-coenzyme A synthetase/AMP-(fatty) acid ligase